MTVSPDRPADEAVDLVAFNGYPDLPEELPNPPRRHAVLARIVAVLAGTLAMLFAAVLVPAAEDLLAIIVVLGPFIGVGALTLAAWDHLVEHRRPALGSGLPGDGIDSLAGRIVVIGGFIVAWLVPKDGLPPVAENDQARVLAGVMSIYLLVLLVLWLAALGLGRAVQRRWGDRPATITLVFAWVFLAVTLLGGIWPRLETATRIGRGADEWAMADGTGLVCWGIDRAPCEQRATLLLAGNAAIRPDETPDYVEIGRDDGDWICTGSRWSSSTCWRVD